MDDRSKCDVNEENRRRADRGFEWKSRPGQSSHRPAAPDRGRRVHSLDIEPLSQNDAPAKETKAANHLGGNSRRASFVIDYASERDEKRRPDRDQRIGSQSGRVLPPLTL